MSAPDPATAAITPLPASERRTYKITLRNTLYELIQTLQIPPGERLVEADLAGRFGVSKTPVREALLMLESDGLVTTVPHVGATVTWLSLHGYEQELFILDALEQPALSLVSKRISPGELDAGAALVERLRAAYEAGGEEPYISDALELHELLFGAARYPLLTELVSSLQRRLRRHTKAFVHQFPESWATEMQLIEDRFEALRAGKPDEAAAAVQRGHASMFDFIRRRVEAGDPAVLRYLDPAERPPG